jgi:exonuclease III
MGDNENKGSTPQSILCTQLNVNKSEIAMDDLQMQLKDKKIDIAFIQEMRIIKGKVKHLNGGVNIYCHQSNEKTRAMIWVSSTAAKSLKCTRMEQFCNQDMATAYIEIPMKKGCSTRIRKAVIVSVYCPHLINSNFQNKAINDSLLDVTDFCK